MAQAWLEPTDYEGQSAWEVRASVFGAAPYEGPPDRDWDSPELRGQRLGYQFRSGADRLRDLAKRFVNQEVSVADVLAINLAHDYLRSQYDHHLDVMDDEDSAEDDASDSDFHRFVTTFLPALVDDPALFHDQDKEVTGYYHFEADAHLRDAARALALPPWATLHSVMAGGPGSGYDAQIITLDEGHTLRELYDWLLARLAP